MSASSSTTMYRYTCHGCNASFVSGKIPAGALGFSMGEQDRVSRIRKDRRYWDDYHKCRRVAGERFLHGVWCSYVHPTGHCMSTQVEETIEWPSTSSTAAVSAAAMSTQVEAVVAAAAAAAAVEAEGTTTVSSRGAGSAAVSAAAMSANVDARPLPPWRRTENTEESADMD